MRAPPNGPSDSVSFAVLHATGAPMIAKPRRRHPVCFLTGLRGPAILIQPRRDPETAPRRATAAVC